MVDLTHRLEPRRPARSASSPRTIFNCVAYGAYSFETDSQLIYQTNFQFHHPACCRAWIAASIACYVHAGSSSEYGDNAAGPDRTRSHRPQQRLRRLQGRRGQPDPLLRQDATISLRNLRLYSVFGPLEDSARLDSQPDPPRPGADDTPSSSTRRSRAISSTSTT